MNVVWALVIGLLGLVSVIISCYRLDKYTPKDKYFGRGNLWERARPLFAFTKKTKRRDFMTVSVVLQIIAYVMIFISLAVFLVYLITRLPGWAFWSKVLSFVNMGFAVLENIFEIVVLEILEIRGEHLD
ncbi:MAG TPA: hypothetical protein PLW60_05495 [Bacilli bacterium]|nr:MAG: hypothetical protein BWY97_00200 [Tenericutes bacterium ADurb.BinA124]HNZ50215.1 hypothetical protein [Bacilli bacterium]HPX83908.1 hypothetical protein [Bacilli bacterium]HQC74959.1 hypothetical protein [Bacilli bacterium]